MDFIKRLRDPEDMADYHIVSFIVQLVVIVGVVLAVFKLVMVVNESGGYEYDLNTGDSFVSSVMINFKAEEGEEKLLRQIPTLSSPYEKVKTDKFIDIKNHGLWLTYRQDVMFTAYLLGVYLANVILVLVGAGPMYRRIRTVLGIITRKMLPFFIFVIPIGIWGMIMCVALYIIGIVVMLLAPFILAYHLIMGIIQIVIMVKD